MIAKRGVAVALLVGLALAACGPKKSPTMDPTVGQQQGGDDVPRPQTAEARIERLGQANEQFAAARKELRGHSDDQARRDLADALGKLQDVLALLKGGDANGAFRQQIRIIERARAQLTSDSATAPEPTINAAVRAARSALTAIASDQFEGDEQLKTLLDALQTRVDTLNTVRGPIHGFEAARALDDTGAITQRMADLMQQRLSQEQPATAPAPAPGSAA